VWLQSLLNYTELNDTGGGVEKPGEFYLKTIPLNFDNTSPQNPQMYNPLPQPQSRGGVGCHTDEINIFLQAFTIMLQRSP